MKRLHNEGKLDKTRERCRAIGKRMGEWIRANGHPRGALGITHSPATRQKIGLAAKNWWSRLTEEEVAKKSLRTMKTRFAHGTYATERVNVSWKGGKRRVGDKEIYFRSRWEANYARYLELLKISGQIRGWEHEPDVFWFETIRRGCVSYLPDFKSHVER